jgi:hypothetical protein
MANVRSDSASARLKASAAPREPQATASVTVSTTQIATFIAVNLRTSRWSSLMKTTAAERL